MNPCNLDLQSVSVNHNSSLPKAIEMDFEGSLNSYRVFSVHISGQPHAI